MTATTTSRPYHHGDLRTALLVHAEEALRRAGVGGVSLRELAREVGVSHGAPRRHFVDKDALLAALAEDGFARLRTTLVAAIGSSGPFADRFRTGSHAYVGFAVEHAALLQLMFAAKHAPEATPALMAASRRAFDPLIDIIRAAQDAGEIIADDPEQVAAAAFAGMHGIASLTTAGVLDAATVHATVDSTTEVMLHGLLPR